MRPASAVMIPGMVVRNPKKPPRCAVSLVMVTTFLSCRGETSRWLARCPPWWRAECLSFASADTERRAVLRIHRSQKVAQIISCGRGANADAVTADVASWLRQPLLLGCTVTRGPMGPDAASSRHCSFGRRVGNSPPSLVAGESGVPGMRRSPIAMGDRFQSVGTATYACASSPRGRQREQVERSRGSWPSARG